MVALVPEDLTIRQAIDADCGYVGVDAPCLGVPETLRRIKDAIPEVYTR